MQAKYASNDDQNAIGQRLKLEMKKRGMSSVELAAKADVKTSFLYDVISGKSANPSSVKLARVAESLGVSLAYLAGTSDIPTEGYQFALPQMESNYVTLPSIYAELAGGKAEIQEKTRREEPLQFKKDLLKLTFGAPYEQLKLFTIQGDSMSPTLCDGDDVIINTAQKHPSPPGLFLLFDSMSLVVKRLEYLPQAARPTVKVMSDNPHYAPYEIHSDKAYILGRVVWFSRSI